MLERVIFYDFQIDSKSWCLVLRELKSNECTLVTDREQLHNFIVQNNGYIYVGFNNKWSTNYLITDILNGATVQDVLGHKQYIEQGNKAWSYDLNVPQHVKWSNLVPTVDLKDDLPTNLTLDAVALNLGLSVDDNVTITKRANFNTEVLALVYKERENYIQSKVYVADMFNIDVRQVLSLTNAQMCAKVFGAVKRSYNDERSYRLPELVNKNLIPKDVLSFYGQITDRSIPDNELFNKSYTTQISTKTGTCPTTYSWGGIHGAKPKYQVVATSNRLIVNYDVVSLYPNVIKNFGYTSRSVNDPTLYGKLVDRRNQATDKDLKVKTGLKPIVNTFYGAMNNQYNALYDPLQVRSTCITNQLLMTMLISLLTERCGSIDYININTDGLIFTIDKSDEPLMVDVINSWCEYVGLTMTRQDFSKLVQKDVNNYIAVKPNGEVKTKGSFVQGYAEGTLKSNSLRIIDKAIVDYLLHDVKVEDTINNESDILMFQRIENNTNADGVFGYMNNQRVEYSKVCRIYAVKDKKYGKLYSYRNTRKTVIQNSPEHVFVDNDNKLTVSQLDKEYYIKIAKDRIQKYTDKQADRQVIGRYKTYENNRQISTIQADKQADRVELPTDDIDCEIDFNTFTLKTNKQADKQVDNTELQADNIDLKADNIELQADNEHNNINNNIKEDMDMSEITIYQKLHQARVRFAQANVKKSGYNSYNNFYYFELSDIVPVASRIFGDLGLMFMISFDQELAHGTLIDINDPQHHIEFTSPMVNVTTKGMNEIQALGAIETYQRRYLYLTALDIVESDLFDGGVEHGPFTQTNNVVTEPIQNQVCNSITSNVIDPSNLRQSQESALTMLKELYDISESHRPYVKEMYNKVRSSEFTIASAQSILDEITQKLAEAKQN